MLKIGHSVIRPGREVGAGEKTIHVPEDLETVPGIEQNPHEVHFDSREYPLTPDRFVFPPGIHRCLGPCRQAGG